MIEMVNKGSEKECVIFKKEESSFVICFSVFPCVLTSENQWEVSDRKGKVTKELERGILGSRTGEIHLFSVL